ncbi:MAG TPA: alpha/beta hydrolase [Acidimicrobiales bacterium]|nr:alpha/beta hydrolase [Acidimicrobiales bacterium]
MRRVAAWTAFVLVAACSDEGGSATSEPTPAPTRAATVTAPSTTPPSATLAPTTAGEAQLTDWKCPPGLPAAAECHRLAVPADWSDPTGGTISLPVAVVRASGPARRGDPIVIPAGGPGFDGLGLAGWSDSPLARGRDVVAYDQRGTGRAEPLLECPERDAAFVANLQQDQPFEAERAAIVAGLTACRARLEGQGIDLDDYDTEASVKDLDAIRRALGYESWNLLGISYGARLGLAAMRSTPEHLRAVILDSVYDVTGGGLAAQATSAERAFQQLADGCAADPECAAAHPDVAAAISAVRDRYNAEPITVDADIGDGAGPRTFVITGDDVMGGLFNALYDAALIPVLPSLLDGLAAGDTSVVPELIRRGVPFATGQADGMQMSVDCADNAGLGEDADRAILAAPGRTRLIVTQALCSEWPVEPTSPDFNQPVTSDLPVLVLAGLYDPITPPAGTEAVASRLANASFGLWPNVGHGVSGGKCANQIGQAFLDTPTAPVNLSCVAAVPGPAFA